jgi:hypothetical protein
MDFKTDYTTPMYEQIARLTPQEKEKLVPNERCDFVDLLLRFYLFQQRMHELS